ncbi:MAG: bifunctional tRNA pseudouridine(32) synthase/23S rRNA pseudouridine(746) synthase RluA [Alphaproteobacteria bacterium]|nr:bifunctional tRNA pseudouridine(32) synthase/23S rRNA pseudouridine(746) synthase RluA [Alphaproteobacteria bacterium]
MYSQPPPPLIYDPPQEPYLSVVYSDDDILILDKPSGLLSVAGRPVEHADCLELRAQKSYPNATIVHRLDMDTSGVMVMALNPVAHRNISMQFERRKTKKTYIARVWGQPEQDRGHIDLPMRCDWPNRPKQIIDYELGKSAQTDWEIIKREDTSTRVCLYPITGRSHQLRVHMLSIGHPILGDNFYATPEAYNAEDRLQLHAESLTLHHPSDGALQTFTVPCPF